LYNGSRGPQEFQRAYRTRTLLAVPGDTPETLSRVVVVVVVVIVVVVVVVAFTYYLRVV
jgi:hypothetical protein